MWPFRKKSRTLAALPFKDGQAFFEFQCQFGQTALVAQRGIVALVKDAKDLIGADQAIMTLDDGREAAALMIASEDGGFLTVAETASPGKKLTVGDVVIWVPIKMDPNNPMISIDQRMAWDGLIAAIVAPKIDPHSDSFDIIFRYA